MTILWFVVLVVCVGGTSVASRRAVTSALRITEAMRISPALVGLTVMSIGTDLPEIANSLVSSASGHGDVNVGDSMGSVLTQVTLVLGLLCLGGATITVDRNFVLSVGALTFFAAVMVWVLASDGQLSHTDGAILIVLWIGGTFSIGFSEIRPREALTKGTTGIQRDLMHTLFWLGLVGAFAIGVVRAFLSLAEAFGIPEFIGSFLALSIGTSLPELVVDWNAIKRGASSMAVGDIFGSSFVDATLSIGVGPAVFSSVVSDDVQIGIAAAGIGVLLAAVLTARARTFNWRLAIPLLVVYGAAQTTVALLQP